MYVYCLVRDTICSRGDLLRSRPMTRRAELQRTDDVQIEKLVRMNHVRYIHVGDYKK